MTGCTLLLALALATPPPAEPRPLQTVLDAGAASGRPVLLYFSEEWCEPCKVVEAAMSRDPALTRSLDRFVLQKYDSSAGVGWDLSNKYRVNSIPAFVVVAADGSAQARRTGGGADLASWLDQQAELSAQARARAAQMAWIERLLFGVAVPTPAVVSMTQPDALWGAQGPPK